MARMQGETVIITGHDLAVEQSDQPQRRRPSKQPSTTTAAGRDFHAFIGTVNPYWSKAANKAAEASTARPIDIAREWAKEKISE